ncbi:YciI family protein [Patulibacter defluvii]|uniref:YciI family protein n=1 Tax=Patulibacter defluvii TaxID=3095358 RepID=UPI002A7492BB|nr:YciI family protein [Patulibacter sp. DM4]
MKYAVLIYADQAVANDRPDEERAANTAKYMALMQAPETLAGEQLQPVDTATTVRAPDGVPLHTDGPFATTKEHMAGFYLIDVEDLDAALAFAAKVPATWLGGAVEVRPLVELPR